MANTVEQIMPFSFEDHERAVLLIQRVTSFPEDKPSDFADDRRTIWPPWNYDRHGSAPLFGLRKDPPATWLESLAGLVMQSLGGRLPEIFQDEGNRLFARHLHIGEVLKTDVSPTPRSIGL